MSTKLRTADSVLREIELEDERQRETLRKFYMRERSNPYISWRATAWFFLKIVVGAAVVWAFVWLWLELSPV